MEYLTAEQVATKLQLHPRTVRRMLAAGQMPGVRIGAKQWRVSAVALEEFMKHGTQPETPKPAKARKRR